MLILFCLYSIFSFSQQDTRDMLLTGLDSNREISAFTDPVFHKYAMLSVSNNKRAMLLEPEGVIWPGYSTIVTTDAGKTWQGRPRKLFAVGYNSGPVPFNPYAYPNSDPTVLIDNKGNYWMTTLGQTQGYIISNSKNQGGIWTLNYASSGKSDKPHSWVDNSETSPFKNNIYIASTYFGTLDVNAIPFFCQNVKFIRSTDGGNTWSTHVQVPMNYTCFVNLTTDKNGTLYIMGTDFSSFQIAKSTDGGLSFTSSATSTFPGFNIAMARALNCPDLLPSEGTFIPNPVILSDNSDEAHSGNLYIIFGSRVSAPNNYNIYCITSSNGGTTWSNPVAIDNSLGQGKFNFLPWSTCDPETGAISVIYFGNKNQSTPCNFDTYVSSSTDGGVTWTQTKVGDFSSDFSSSPYITSRFSGRIGEYNAITSGNGMVYPFWMDARNTQAQVYSSPFVVPYCDPNAPSTKNLTGTYNTRIKEKAVSAITATSTIDVGSKVKYVAGSSIELNPGFSTSISINPTDENYFSAYINEGCSPVIPVKKFSVISNAPLCTGKTIYLRAENVGATSYSWTGPAGFTSGLLEPSINNATLSHSGRYSCLATLPNSSTLSDFVDITVKQTPAKVYIKNSDNPCNNTLPITLLVEDPGNLKTYYWKFAPFNQPTNFKYIGPLGYGANPPVTPGGLPWPQNPLIVRPGSAMSSGYYLCQVENEGCNVETNVIKIPSTPVLVQNGICCTTSNLRITNASDYINPAFTWKDPNNVIIGNTNPVNLNCLNIPGNYTCIVNAEGCQLTNTISVTLNLNCRMIPDKNEYVKAPPLSELDIRLSPNPCNGSFTLSMNGIKSKLTNLTIEVFTESGQKIYTKFLSEFINAYFIQLPSGISNGVYFVKTKFNNSAFTAKLIVQKNMILGTDLDETDFKESKIKE